MKNIVVCCDGTGNEYGANNTNVVTAYALARESAEQCRYYDPGVGTGGWVYEEEAGILRAAMNQATGHGLQRNVEDACRFLMQALEPRPPVDADRVHPQTIVVRSPESEHFPRRPDRAEIGVCGDSNREIGKRDSTEVRPIEVIPRGGYRIWIRYSDGASGEVDLSHLAGRGVFEAWNERAVFESVQIASGGAIAWGDDIDLCPDAIYMQLTGKCVEEVMSGAARTVFENA